jgi:prepilin-type N-terminal cleavage/methylation domain-containing protein
MRRALRDTRGFTLAELLIAVAILGFMMGALFTLQRQGQLAYLSGAARVEVQQNARLALDMMISDIRSALPVAGTTRIITAIDANCATGAPPALGTAGGGGGTSIGFTDQDGNAVTYSLVGASCTTAANGCDLQKNGATLIGGVQELQIWCYDNASPAALSAAPLDNIREIRIQIRTKTERTAQAGSAGDQHARIEGRVRLRNI